MLSRRSILVATVAATAIALTSLNLKNRLPVNVPARTRKSTVRYEEQCACKIAEVPGLSAQCATAKNYGEWNGAQGRNRTTDTAIFNRMLYQLSYLGAKAATSPASIDRAGRAGRYRGPVPHCPEPRKPLAKLKLRPRPRREIGFSARCRRAPAARAADRWPRSRREQTACR